MEELLKHVGLGVPYVLALTTYGIFWWLDNNIADEHSKIITSWLHGRSQNTPDLGNLIISAFDRIYTSPLLTFRAFRRSALISSIIWIFTYFIPLFIIYYLPPHGHPIVENLPLITLIEDSVFTLPFIIMSDYVSLFVVRKLLVMTQAHPVLTGAGAVVSGAAILVLFISLVIAGFTILNSNAILWQGSEEAMLSVMRVEDFIILGGSPLGVLMPALIVHLWIPIFALSSLIVKLGYWTFRAVEWAQWLLKQGDEHPLKAIGIVATIVVFGSAILVKEGWTLLGVLERS